MSSILLVEDTAVLAEQIADLLFMEGSDVVIARHGREALSKLQSLRPDLVITDLLMPEMDGFELIHRMKKIADLQTIPIIVLTAKNGEETDGRLEELGIQQLLRKPCNAEDLIEAVRKIIRKV